MTRPRDSATATATARSPGRSRLAGVVLLLAVSFTTMAQAQAQAPLRVIHPRQESARDARVDYPLALLRLALDHAGQPYDLRPAVPAMQQSRALRELERGELLDVAWTVTDRERESRLRPIRFPIDRGLIGWRLLLVHRGDARFEGIDDIAALAPLRLGQGHDWPDVAVLRANGLTVSPSPTYDGLFAMLARGHVDAFPRSLAEAPAELAAHADLPIALEPRLALHYPAALYFFVNKRNDALAAAIATGLERSLRDGSLDRLFAHYYADAVRTAALPTRRVLELRNPELPAATPLARQELWFRP